MARIRTVKPEFHAHEELSLLPPETHLLAAALINYADDHGYFNANPALVKAGTNPLRSDKTKIEEQLAQLEQVGYIVIRRSGIKQIGQVVAFEEHQRVSHPAESKLKGKFESLRKSSGETPESLRRNSGVPPPLRELKGIEFNGIEGNVEAPSAGAHVATAFDLPVLGTLPLVDKTNWKFTQADVSGWEEAYPAVNVMGELRQMREYFIANPTKKKTRTGIRRAIVTWLSKEQDKPERGNSNVRKSITQQNLEDLQDIARRLDAADGADGGLVSQPEDRQAYPNALSKGVERDRRPALVRAV